MPDPSGALVPPPRKPPTAIAAATPLPPPQPRSRAVIRHRSRTINLSHALVGFVASLLDAADVVADSIAEELGLREANREPSAPRNSP